MNKRNWRSAAIAAVVVGSIGLAGCSADPAPSSSDEPAESTGTLIVYTNSNSDGRGEWVTEKAAEEGLVLPD